MKYTIEEIKPHPWPYLIGACVIFTLSIGICFTGLSTRIPLAEYIRLLGCVALLFACNEMQYNQFVPAYVPGIVMKLILSLLVLVGYIGMWCIITALSNPVYVFSWNDFHTYVVFLNGILFGIAFNWYLAT